MDLGTAAACVVGTTILGVYAYSFWGCWRKGTIRDDAGFDPKQGDVSGFGTG